jgi:hypothetical protein
MPNRVKKMITEKYPLIPTGSLSEQFGLSIPHFKRLMRAKKITEGIHYFKVPGSPSILWNRDILADWIANGGLESPAHARACEQFIAYLPSSHSA